MDQMKIEAVRDEYIAADAEGKAKLLAKTYGLQKHQLWQHKQSKKWIVSHAGIESIAAQENIMVAYSFIRTEPDLIIIQATPTVGDEAKQSTFGEASPANTKMPYPVAMAEKRGFDRSVLKAVLSVVGGHGADFYGEDEADDFRATAAPRNTDFRPQDRRKPIDRAKAMGQAERAEDAPANGSDGVMPGSAQDMITFMRRVTVEPYNRDEMALALDVLNNDHSRKRWKKPCEAWIQSAMMLLGAEDAVSLRQVMGAYLKELGGYEDRKQIEDSVHAQLAEWMAGVANWKHVQLTKAAA